MKPWTWLALIVTLVVMGTAWTQHIRAVRAEAIVETLEVERDSALVRVVQLEEQATEAQEIVDSLVSDLTQTKAEAHKEIRVLSARADSLGNALISLAEPGPVRDTTQALVEAMFAAHRAEIAEYDNLLRLSDETITALQNQVRVEQEINDELRQALDITTRQRDAWQRAANPGLLSKLKTAAIGFGIGVITWEVVR